MYFEPDARTHRPACCCATYTSTCGYKSARYTSTCGYKSASSNTRKRLFTGKGRQRATGRARSKVPTLNLFPARGLTEKKRKLFGGGPVSQGVAEEIYKNTSSGNYFLKGPPHPAMSEEATRQEGLGFGPLPWRLRLPNGHFGSFGRYPKHCHKEKIVFFSYALLVLCWCSPGALFAASRRNTEAQYQKGLGFKHLP